MDVVKLELGSGSYFIYIGQTILERLGELLRQQQLSDKVLVVSDRNVGAVYGDCVLQSLRQAGFSVELLLVAPGEETKSLAQAEPIFTKAIELGLDRKSPMIALGGGVVGDLTGFIAATYLRGVPFIQVPTSLLAQVDSSIGGKVAVNHPLGKNLIGCFYQPRLVMIDTDTISTLPERELATGLAEIIKHGLIADQELFEYLHTNATLIAGRQPAALRYIIQRSCRIKGAVVEQDEREAGLRMTLNFGHTIAHAIEATAGYGKFTHGEAVAVGMYGAALIGARLGLCSQALVADVRHILNVYHLPVSARGCAATDIFSALYRDKKVVAGKLRWVLLTAVGHPVIQTDVPDEIVRQVLAELTCG